MAMLNSAFLKTDDYPRRGKVQCTCLVFAFVSHRIGLPGVSLSGQSIRKLTHDLLHLRAEGILSQQLDEAEAAAKRRHNNSFLTLLSAKLHNWQIVLAEVDR